MENRSSSHKPATSLLILLILGVVILGILVALQNREIHRLGDEQKPASVAAEPTPVAIAPTTTSTQKTEQGTNLVVATKTVAGKYVITHYCDGTVVSTNFTNLEPVKYCLGKNTLAYSDGNRTKTLASEMVIDGYQEAPILLNVQFVSSTIDVPRLLIEYKTDTCLTTNTDCPEISMPSDKFVHFNMVFNIGDLTVRQISNFPVAGTAVWNAAGTRALFIGDTCGEGGCNLSEIIGYDINHDTVNPVTTEKAVGGDYPASEINMFGPHWKSVIWVTDSKFTATIVSPDGKTKTISGTF